MLAAVAQLDSTKAPSTPPEKKRKTSSVSFDLSENNDHADTESAASSVTINSYSPRQSTDTNSFYSIESENQHQSDDELLETRIEDLTTKMKSTKITQQATKQGSKTSSAPPYMQVLHPHIITTYECSNKLNKMVHLEVQLPSGTEARNVFPSIETSGSHQYFVLKEKICPNFMSTRKFAEYSAQDPNFENINHARKKAIRDLKQSFPGDGSTRYGLIYVSSRYQLPFICDNFFSLPRDVEPYPGTGYRFIERTIITANNNDEQQVDHVDDITHAHANLTGAYDLEDYMVEHNNMDKMKKVVVRLVSAEKELEREEMPTPTRNIARQVQPRSTDLDY